MRYLAINRDSFGGFFQNCSRLFWQWNCGWCWMDFGRGGEGGGSGGGCSPQDHLGEDSLHTPVTSDPSEDKSWPFWHRLLGTFTAGQVSKTLLLLLLRFLFAFSSSSSSFFLFCLCLSYLVVFPIHFSVATMSLSIFSPGGIRFQSGIN